MGICSDLAVDMYIAGGTGEVSHLHAGFSFQLVAQLAYEIRGDQIIANGGGIVGVSLPVEHQDILLAAASIQLDHAQFRVNGAGIICNLEAVKRAEVRACIAAVRHFVVPDEIHALQICGSGLQNSRGEVVNGLLTGFLQSRNKQVQILFALFCFQQKPGRTVGVGSAKENVILGYAGGHLNLWTEQGQQGVVITKGVGGVYQDGGLFRFHRHAGDGQIVGDSFGNTGVGITGAVQANVEGGCHIHPGKTGFQPGLYRRLGHSRRCSAAEQTQSQYQYQQ